MIEVINMQKQKISHCQNNYKIQSKNRKIRSRIDAPLKQMTVDSPGLAYSLQ